MSLSDEYRTAQATADMQVPLHDGQVRKIHAVMPHADATICGKVEALDVTYVKPAAPGHRYAVTCDDCLKALKRERQRRSREGTARAAERRAQQVEEAPPLTEREAAYKKQRDDLLAFMQSAPVSSGVCCCGSDMEKHGMYDGHSPVDTWDYAVQGWAKQIAEFDAENPTP
jgi:hypothetical protein